MNRSLFPALIVGATLGAVAMPVHALTCYEVIDRTDTVIFRNLWTPVDLSIAGARLRDAMRERGELLVIFDAPACVVVERSTGAGNRKLSTDEIVAQWPDVWSASSYRLWSPTFGSSSLNFGNSSTNGGGPSVPAQPSAGTPPKSSSY